MRFSFIRFRDGDRSPSILGLRFARNRSPGIWIAFGGRRATAPKPEKREESFQRSYHVLPRQASCPTRRILPQAHPDIEQASPKDLVRVSRANYPLRRSCCRASARERSIARLWTCRGSEEPL